MKQLLLLVFLLTTLIFSPFQSKAQGKKYVIANVNVIPLHINKVLKNQDVFIENGLITKIAPHVNRESYEVAVIQGVDKYLLPGYADAHVHLPESEDLETFFWMQLRNGVTSVRSMRGKPWHLEIKDKIAAGMTAPRLFLSAPAISRRDSFTREEAAALVQKHQEDGYDFVKILSVKNLEIFHFVADAAEKYQLPLAGHCPNNVGIFNLSKTNNYHSIEHLGGLSQLPDHNTLLSGISTSINANIYHDATLDWYYTGHVTEDDLRKRAGVQYLPKSLIEKWESRIAGYHEKADATKREADRAASKKKFATRLQDLNLLYRQGAKLLLSPDASGIYGIPGYGMYTEMQHYAEAGISNFDILKASCYNMAEMLDQSNNWGSIKEGSSPDLVLLDANPLEDIANTQKVLGIFLKGEFLSVEVLQEFLEKSYER